MLQKYFVSAAALAALSPIAGAAERSESLPLWSQNEASFGNYAQFSGIDFDDSIPGIETIGFNMNSTTDTDGSLSRMRWSYRIEFFRSDTDASLAQFRVATSSDWYPNDDTNYDYYCNNEFWPDLNNDNSVEDCEPTITVGIAEGSGGSRYLAVGTSLILDYWRFSDEGEADVYKVTIFDLASNQRAWQQAWPLEEGVWELDPALSGIDDYLGGDGVDEVRVARIREYNNGDTGTQYIYLNIATGAEIKRTMMRTARPGI